MRPLCPLRIGTRGSELALWQARHVAERLASLPGAPPTELIEIRTEGDRITDVPLTQVSGKDFFTREIEQALLGGEADLAVHSLKDLATVMPEGLALAAVLPREDARDVLIGGTPGGLEALPTGARVGTSSLRRRAMIARWRHDLELLDLRGNVPTRIRRVEEGRFDAIVLAAAGVKRLGLLDRVSAFLPMERVLPAPGQGAIAVQVRAGDLDTQRWVDRLDDAATRFAVVAERALLRRLEGGCQVPVGAFAALHDGRVTLQGVVCSLDGRHAVEGRMEGAASDAEALGVALAEDLLRRGADDILAGVRGSTGTSRGR